MNKKEYIKELTKERDNQQEGMDEVTDGSEDILKGWVEALEFAINLAKALK